MAENLQIADPAPRLSVVIPTLDRAVELQSCLAALARDFPTDAEVIVVSDGGDRHAFPDLSEFAERLRLTIIHAEHGGPAHARNLGLERARGEIVAFTDDDCRPHPGWLQELAGSVRFDPPTAAGGRTLNGLPDSTYATAAQLILDMGERDQAQRRYGPGFFPTNNVAFPTAALRAIGAFDENYRTSEDRELCRRWLRTGYALVKAPDACVTHLPSLNFRSFWRKYVAYGMGAARFHNGSSENWQAESAAFHRRIPGLAAAEMAEQNVKRKIAVYAILMVWELANLLGYLRGKRSIRE